MQSLSYHNIFLSKLKSEIGASFCGYERTKDKYRLKVTVNKITDWFDLEGTPEDVSPKRYKELIDNLKQHYEKV